MTREGGSASLVVAAATAVVASSCIAVTAIALVYAARNQAIIAADAAALAAAVGTYPPAARESPTVSAADIAMRNGAVLISCACPRDPSTRIRMAEVVTAVPVDVPIFGEMEVRAVARAEFDPLRWLGR